MKSFALLRTNVGLTTNMKVIVDSNYNLFLDSIESNPELGLNKYKKVRFSKKNFYDELIPYFYDELTSEIAFEIKYENDVDKMSSDFSQQYDELYNYGARNIINNKNYDEEFEYFAPLHVNKNSLPSHFVIFRVDGPGVNLMTKENFIDEIVNKFKPVKIFDLGLKTTLGEWLDLNFKNNKYFPLAPLEFDFRELEFCKWNGIDYKSGGYISKSFFIDDYIEKEKEIFEFEKYVLDNYQRTGVVYPNIINFSFLFDDEPSTPDVKRKWSINRYYGFYIDKMIRETSFSPYIAPFLRADVEIQEGNVIYSASNQDPFVEGFSDNRPFYVEYNGDFYKVEKFTELSQNQLASVPTGSSGGVNTVVEQYINIEITKYRIISDIDLSGKQSELNKNYTRIENNFLINYQNTKVQAFSDFDKYSVWLIEIEGIYHTLVNDGGFLKIHSDYSFIFNENDFRYKVAGVTTIVDSRVTNQSPPKKFNVYKLAFTDIKDFDTRIVDTDASKFEYEKTDDLTYTDETKLYLENLSTTTTPRDYDDYIYNGEVVNIPVASEYTANFETFKVTNNELSEIWRKNSVYCRWGYVGSISSNDYPYILNNSFVFEDLNRTSNPFDNDPKRIERNLDYFYTINSSTSSYVHHSLHIESFDENGDIDSSFQFDLGKYLNVVTYSVGTGSATYSLDYFTDFFYQRQYFENGSVSKNVKKYAELSSGDNSTPNNTVFRGLKFLMYDVDAIELSNEGELSSINLSTSNQFEGYKISVLLSDNDKSLSSNNEYIDTSNSMIWKIISEWKMDTLYATSSIVLFNDILYISNKETETTSPVKELSFKTVKSAPYNSNDWDFYSPVNSIFWQPVRNQPYTIGDFVYNYGDYWKCISTLTSSNDFWNPQMATVEGYSIGDIVLYKDQFWASQINNNQFSPDYNQKVFKVGGFVKPWVATQSSQPTWERIELWNPILNYTANKLVFHKETVWLSTSNIESGEEPSLSNLWVRKYSLEPDTDYVYTQTSNPIIEMNNSYYLCESNINSSTLDNGIIIYVNKKWKNILVNINISDNTLPNIKNCDRDLLYTELYRKLTAANFLRAVNDVDTKYGFTDYVKYVVIHENNEITQHTLSNNLKSLDCMLRVDEPDEFLVRNRSLDYVPLENPQKLKPLRKLKNGEIKNLDQLNWYNELPLAVDILEVPDKLKAEVGLGGNTSRNSLVLYRHSGFYMPIFYDIQLFDKQLDGISDNTRFDISLTDFGLMKERKIQKINKSGSILKLKNETDVKSIYPMLDEFGYTVRDFFIFSSTWDHRYHYESYVLNFKPKFNIELPSLSNQVLSQFGQSNQNNSNL